MRRRRNLAALGATLVLLASAATAIAIVEPGGSSTATAGNVAATMTWSAGPKTIGGVSKPHLMIVRAGVTALNREMTTSAKNPADIEYLPGSLLNGGSLTKPTPLQVVDLDGDGDPEVIVGYFTDGAHCCYQSAIFQYDPGTATYDSHVFTWGDTGVSIKDLNGDGKADISGRDWNFAYTFTDFADSFAPVLIQDYSGGVLINVTSRFPTLVATDAAKVLKDIKQVNKEHGDVRGIVAVYVAEEDITGHTSTASKFLSSEIAHHDLGSATTAAKYRTKLTKFLKQEGYLRS